MKPKIFKPHLYYILLLISSGILFTSCDKVSWEEEQTFRTFTPPGFSIYKTKGVYFDLATVGMQDDEIIRKFSYSYDNKLEINGGKITYKYRTKLVNGYVLDEESAYGYDAFLDLTIAEHYYWEIENERPTMPNELIRTHILDTNPYIEYWSIKDNLSIRELSLADINRLIKRHQLSLYFNKLK